MSTLIRCENLGKDFGAKKALDGISFSVEKGAPVALVGPNGAGKTTLFSLLCGYLSADRGDISILGHKPGSAALFGKLAALPQDANLDPRFAVHQQLVFYGRLQGMSKKEAVRQADRCLELVGLSDVARQAPGELSHGMRKRVSIAQALLGEPQLVLLDEATAGLDPVHARQVRELVASLADEVTFILSSHDLAELERLCAHVLHLEQGKLITHRREETGAALKHLTLRLAKKGEGIEESLALLEGVSRVYQSQDREYVIEYRGDIAPDVALLTLCRDKGWVYQTLINGHTLENQIFQS